MSTGRQLPLPLAPPPSYQEADFIAAASNAAARAWLARGAEWPAGRLCLVGPAGVGKTHLLHLWAARVGAAILSGPTVRGPPEVGQRPLALDDADCAADEAALLFLVNRAAEEGVPLLLAARTPPARWSLKLADLASRLRASGLAEIAPPEDELLSPLLARLAAERGLALAPALARWLLARLPREAGILREALARLDRSALAAGRPLTRRLAEAVLADLLSPSAGADANDASPSGPGLL